MATTEQTGLFTYIDESGNMHILYPVTTMEAVDGLPDALAGKAPAGYGLGEQVYYSNRFYSMAELDNLKKTCDFAITISAGVTINNISFGQAYGRHTAYLDGGHHQELFMLGMGCVLERDCWNGVWSPWDCRNPPMDLGVEYRTIYRRNGKPEYWKLVKYEQSTPITGNAEIYIPHGIENLDRTLITVDAGVGMYTLPYIASSESTNINAVNLDSIALCTSGNTNWPDGATWYFLLKYTKTTD